jgi:hypothetical protein
MADFDGTLDLTGTNPDQIGFPAIPSGRYEAHVGKAEWRTTENIDGTKQLPHGTHYLALGIRVNQEEEPRDGQSVAGVYAGWTNLFVPPADYDATKAQSMKNRMANFLNAIGEDYRKKGYKIPNTDDLVGKELTVIVRKKFDRNRDENVNEIEGFKPAGSSNLSDEPSGLLR